MLCTMKHGLRFPKLTPVTPRVGLLLVTAALVHGRVSAVDAVLAPTPRTVNLLASTGQNGSVQTRSFSVADVAVHHALDPTAQQSSNLATSDHALTPRRSDRRGRDSAQVIRTWHALAAEQPTNPIRQSRMLAMVNAAMHDAVNGAVPVYHTYASWLSDRSANAEAAAAAAAHRVLVNLVPANTASFDAQLANSLATIPDGSGEDAGVALGSAVGQLIVDFRVNDGMAIPDPFNPASRPGGWEPTPPAFAQLVEPQMQNVTPFTILGRHQFNVEPTPDLLSEEYTRDYDEVKAVGQDTSSVRTDDQTHYAHFWFEPSNVGWSRIAAIYTSQRGTNLHDTARLFALLNMAMADGYIAGWYWKRTYAFWRPITAIRKGDTDRNAHTDPNPAWNPLRPTPPSPDYPSTHSALGTAAAQILRRFAGSDRFAFCMVSSSSVPAGSARCYRSFSQAADENADSRVSIGYHFRFATKAGMKLGRRIGNFAFRHNLEPLKRSSRRTGPRRISSVGSLDSTSKATHGTSRMR